MKFEYHNDTQRIVSIHPAMSLSGIKVDLKPIVQGEVRTFILPEGTYPRAKMWDYGGKNGLQILVMEIEDKREMITNEYSCNS